LKVPLCDFCLVKGILTVASTRGQTALVGCRLTMCKAHNKNWKAIASETNQVAEILADARKKIKEMRA